MRAGLAKKSGKFPCIFPCNREKLLRLESCRLPPPPSSLVPHLEIHRVSHDDHLQLFAFLPGAEFWLQHSRLVDHRPIALQLPNYRQSSVSPGLRHRQMSQSDIFLSASMPPSAMVSRPVMVNTVGLSIAQPHSDRRIARITTTAHSGVSVITDAIGTSGRLFMKIRSMKSVNRRGWRRSP
jgi:hypothetical protein